MHRGLLLTILRIQQLSTPPGFSPHIDPPQTPHCDWQQTRPKLGLFPTIPKSQFGSSDAGEGVTDVDSDGDAEGLAETEGVTDGEGVGDSITHGGNPCKHEPAFRRIRGMQQPSTPPGRDPQSAPPHTPQDERQQTEPKLRVAIIPVEQSGSAVKGEEDAEADEDGLVEALGEMDGDTEGLGEAEATTQGGKAVSQLTPERRILLTQQLPAPPGAFAHIGPPHCPQELAQQTVPPGRD